MTMSRGEPHLSEAQIAELAALADGSLPERRRAAAQALVDGSPELRELLDEQRRAIARVQAFDAPAPAGLRSQLRDSRRGSGRRAPFRPAVAIGAAVAVVAIAAVVLRGAGSADPTVIAAAGLAQRGPSAAAPPPERGRPRLLAADVAGVSFPNYTARFGWRAVGARADSLEGRATRTVFYARGARRIAYTIVSGRALAPPGGAQRVVREGTELRFVARAGTTLVTWERGGHTCVLSGSGVPARELLDLAGWKGQGAIEF
jgi:ferric-dicitrate binding protein FerR (iron transport regulator)